MQNWIACCWAALQISHSVSSCCSGFRVCVVIDQVRVSDPQWRRTGLSPHPRRRPRAAFPSSAAHAFLVLFRNTAHSNGPCVRPEERLVTLEPAATRLRRCSVLKGFLLWFHNLTGLCYLIVMLHPEAAIRTLANNARDILEGNTGRLVHGKMLLL